MNVCFFFFGRIYVNDKEACYKPRIRVIDDTVVGERTWKYQLSGTQGKSQKNELQQLKEEY